MDCYFCEESTDDQDRVEFADDGDPQVAHSDCFLAHVDGTVVT